MMTRSMTRIAELEKENEKLKQDLQFYHEIPEIDEFLRDHFDYLRETGWDTTVDEQGNIQWEQNDSDDEDEDEQDE